MKTINLQRSPALVVCISFLALLGSFGSFTYAVKANADQVARQRKAFCGIMVSVAYPPSFVSGPTTPYGQNQQRQFKDGAKNLGCSIPKQPPAQEKK